MLTESKISIIFLLRVGSTAFCSTLSMLSHPTLFFCPQEESVYLLYIDDSGAIGDKNCTHCVLAGFAIYETQTYWLGKAVDNIMQKYFPSFSGIELHGTDIRSGAKAWRGIPAETRKELMHELLSLISTSYPQIVLFGSVIAKPAASGIDISENLFTQVASRFDMFLKRKYYKNNNKERGIAIFDKCTTEYDIQRWSHIFQDTGHQWGDRLRNLAEVPLFLDSKMSRLIQLADIIAYSLFRKYEHNDDQYFSIIKDCFDQEGGVTHGLHVLS